MKYASGWGGVLHLIIVLVKDISSQNVLGFYPILTIVSSSNGEKFYPWIVIYVPPNGLPVDGETDVIKTPIVRISELVV